MKSLSIAKTVFNIFFWTFNGSLLLVVYLGLLPFIGMAILTDAANGQVPLNFLIPFIGLVGIPASCTVAGIAPKTRQLSLFHLFYGIEAPLLTLCLMRFFWLRDLTAANALILATGLVGTIAFAHWLLQGRSPAVNPQPPAGAAPASPRSIVSDPVSSGWHLAGQTLMLLMALYLVTIAAFYVLPSVRFLLDSFFDLVVFATILFPITVLCLGLASIPFGMGLTYAIAWRRTLAQLLPTLGKWGVGGLVVGVLVVWLAGLAVLQQQPQAQAFALLQSAPETTSQRQALLQQSDLIRRGLLNAYLAPYRYPYIEDENRGIADTYEFYLSFPSETAEALQRFYNLVTAPFTYRGSRADVEKAATLYAEFFDAPILRAEQNAVKQAIQSTFDRNEAKAGLLDIGEQRVWLAEQEVTVTPQGDWADIELHEVYSNTTLDQEEILYYFSLPETAAITGLWLGETADRRQFPFTIAPRGAAQQVYNQEVTRRVDPALLEQVGPRQYRLRAFPVPPLGQGKLHLWLSYKVLQQQGGWPMPELSEHRNVYWTSRSKRLIDGKSTSSDQWLPGAVPAQAMPATAHQIDLPWGAQVLATPFADQDYQLPQGKRLAIVLDGSYSMAAQRQPLTQTIAWLQKHILNQNQADLYLTTAAPAKPQRLDNLQGFQPEKAVFYGTLQPHDMLQQFQKLRGNTAYDAILLITDSGSYELSSDRDSALAMPAPLWLVHLGGLQAAYDDATLQAIQDSGGNVGTEIQTVMQRMGTNPSQGAGTSLINLADGYAWFVTQKSAGSPERGFEPLAARQWVTHLSHYVKPDQLQQLDTIHAITKDYGIVTPYSSMLVLVNDAQREDLRRAEQASDRFKREVEDQQLPQPNANPAVPEPAEWLLLLLAAIGLGLIYWHRIRHQVHQTEDGRSLN